MKLQRQIIKVVVAGAVIFSACSTPNNMSKNNYTVTPNPLEAKGDSVAVSINANVPAKSFNNKAILTFKPYLKTESGKEIALKEYTLGGIKSKGNADLKLDSKIGGKVTYSTKVAYTPEMRRSTLKPRFTYNNAEVTTGTNNILAEGVISTAYLVKKDGPAALVMDDYTPKVTNKVINIYFPINVANFNPNFSRGKMINNKSQINELKKALKSDLTWVAKGIAINAFASPDGELARNANLSKGRSESTFKHFKKELKKLGFAEVNDANFTMGYTTSEDWNGFSQALAGSNLSDKNEIIAIINNKSISDEEKEGLIKRSHVKSWNKAAESMLPLLRRSELVVSGTKPLKSEDQLLSMYGQYDNLTLEELFHLGVITRDNNKKVEVFNAYIAKKSDDWRGYNNLAVAQIQLGQLDEASSNLDKALGINAEAGDIHANFGVIAERKGNRILAERYYRAAASKGAKVNYHLGIIAIQNGNYAEAVTLFNKSDKKDFNAALANLLNGDANTASDIIGAIPVDQLDWTHYYLRAVAGARLNNQDIATTNLARAVSMNGEARKMAKSDVEFIKLWSNPLFEAAIR